MGLFYSEPIAGNRPVKTIDHITGEAMSNKITMAAVGDIIISRNISVHDESQYLEAVNLIRNADISFANLETLLHDYEDDAYPTPASKGSFMRADPSLIEDVKWFGFNVVSTANNHSMDYMYGGLLRSIQHLKNTGVKFAGTGVNLAAARQPAYFETARGRVGFIAAASTFAPHCRAGAARRDLHGRPGLNPLRYESYEIVSQETMEKMKELDRELSGSKQSSTESELSFLGKRFVVGNEVGTHTKADANDLEGNLEAVRDAVRQADWVVIALHTHEYGRSGSDSPAMFHEEFARACIDVGAHAVIMHGAHKLKAIEIYKKRPIFYSLGNFIYQNMTIEKMPAEFYERFGLDPYAGTPADAFDGREHTHHSIAGDDAWKRWVSIIPTIEFDNNGLKNLTLTPVELGGDKSRSQRGRPRVAGPEQGRQIIENLAALSKPYGTQIQFKDNKGCLNM